MTPLLLVDSGRPAACIVVAHDASSTERYAATELQEHIEQISGARLSISTEPSDNGAAIFIGRTPQSDLAMGAFDRAEVGPDGCVVRSAPSSLILAGNTSRATLYAVYEFLEEILGCRWLTAGVSVIPQQQTIEIGPVDIAHTPPFRYRETFFSIAEDGAWAARNRTNGAHARLLERHGGRWVYAGFVHTFYELVPPEKYFQEHPEYFSFLDGERRAEGGQLCLTNPELVEVVADAVRKRLLSQPDANILSISQNDHYGNCQCDRCQTMDEVEGSPSGAMVRFVNAVAEKLEDEFPHLFFDTLAYTYCVAPPRHARPRHNVIIRLCNISPVCDAHPLEGCDINAPFVGYLKRWGEIAPEVFIWDYYTNFLHYFMPLPNLDAICADVPLFARSGVTGLFCQADGMPPKGSGEFAELRAYLLAKLMWRPERDGKEIISEFLRLYYGPAAEHIQAYIDLVHAPVRDGRAHFDLYCSLDQPFLTETILDAAEALFEKAIASVHGEEVLKERVATARLPIEYVRLRQNARFVVQRNRLEPADPDVIEVAERFITRASRHGARGLREGGRPLEAELTVLRGYDLTTLENGRLRLVLGPAIGGRIVSFVDLSTGEEWLHSPPTHAPDYPFAGGYEEYSEARWHSPGWTETYAVEQSGDFAQMSANLSNGIRIERSYRLHSGDLPGLTIESRLTNVGSEPKHAVLRSHPEFAGLDLKKCRIEVAGGRAETRSLSPWPTEEGGAGLETSSLWLEESEVPAGKWSLARGGRALTIEFDPSKIEKCLLDWRGPENAVTMELFGTPVLLQPGESFGLSQRWSTGTAG